MNVLDFGIVVCAAAFFVTYKRLSFTYYLLCTSGCFLGYMLGLYLVPSITKNLTSDLSKGMVALGIIFGLAVLSGLAGMFFGRKIRMKIIGSRLFRADKFLVWPYKVIAVLMGIILLSQTLIYVPLLSLQFVAQGSSLLMATDKLLPPSLIEMRAKQIAPTQFHDIQLEYDPNPVTFNNIVDAGDFQAVVDVAAPSVVKVSGRSCIGLGFGSGFVVGPGLVVTNAHVVAGSSTIYISDHQGAYPATPVLIDPGYDIAVLYSKFIDTPPLALINSKANSGTESIILGYTGGGDLQMKKTTVADSSLVNFNSNKSKLTAANSLTFNGGIGVAGPGNSGGPVFNHDGEVIGVVNAGHGNDLVAISSSQVLPLITKAKGKLFPTRTDLCDVFPGYY